MVRGGSGRLGADRSDSGWAGRTVIILGKMVLYLKDDPNMVSLRVLRVYAFGALPPPLRAHPGNAHLRIKTALVSRKGSARHTFSSLLLAARLLSVLLLAIYLRFYCDFRQL